MTGRASLRRASASKEEQPDQEDEAQRHAPDGQQQWNGDLAPGSTLQFVVHDRTYSNPRAAADLSTLSDFSPPERINALAGLPVLVIRCINLTLRSWLAVTSKYGRAGTARTRNGRLISAPSPSRALQQERSSRQSTMTPLVRHARARAAGRSARTSAPLPPRRALGALLVRPLSGGPPPRPHVGRLPARESTFDEYPRTMTGRLEQDATSAGPASAGTRSARLRASLVSSTTRTRTSPRACPQAERRSPPSPRG